MFKNLNPMALGVTGHQSELIELALTYGFQGIDLPIVEFTTRVEKHGMPYARRLLDSAKLNVGVFELPLEWDVDEDIFQASLKRLDDYAKAAIQVGASRCKATIEPAGDNRPLHENFEFHKRHFSQICQTLQPHGIQMGIGFRAAKNLRKEKAFQFIHDMDALLMLVNMVGEDNMGIVLDTWELHVSGGSLDQIRRLPKEQIVAVQLADVPEDVPIDDLTETQRLLPGTTNQVDFSAILTALAGMGYQGPVTPMPEKTSLDSTRRDPIVRQTAEAFNGIWKEAGLSSESPVTSVV